MKVLVDTSVWYMALRRTRLGKDEEIILEELKDLIRDIRVQMIGPIRQEILSGISDEERYEELKERMSAFHDDPVRTEDYELAAKFSNECRTKGVQGSHTDFLICAVAVRNESSIYTTDKDFEMYKEYIPIALHKFNN